jgi:hypothetical protein
MSRLWVAALLASTIVACGGGGDEQTSEPPPDWPMTGLAAADPSVDVEGPVMVVKVDNTAKAFPQQGLAAADILVEEPVEGGVTRLAVFLHSDIDGTIGPVRSVRTSDIGVVSPADAVLVASGGAPEVVVEMQDAGIETRFEDSPGFSRDSVRAAPFNLFLDAGEAYAELDEPGPPGPFFTFGTPALDGEPAGAIDLVFSPAQTTRLTFADGTWTRDLAEPDGFEATTVLALLVDQGTADYLDPSGAPVPINLTEGTGSGFMATDGQVVQVEWSKESADDPWTFSVDGEDVPVPPGRTYLALLPVATGSLQIEAPAGAGSSE